jgi:hypothetical protein
MKRLALPKSGRCAIVLAAVLWLSPQGSALAQQGEAKGESKGENFSAKPPAALFASDCTGAGCHKGPQGLAKAGGIGLAGFLREHYTNSRESAAALASYLAKLPSGPEPKDKSKDKETRTARPTPAAVAPSERAGFSSSEPGALMRPEPREAKTPPKPNTRTSRAPAKPEEEPQARSHPAMTEPGEKPAPASRAAQPARPATAAAAPASEAAPTPPPAPAATQPPASPSPAHASAPSAPKQYDIFD